jgi:NADH dehydrogenase
MQKVVIVGAGFGGLNAAKEISKDPRFMVTLLDRTNHHLFQPLLYQVATAALSPGDIAMPVREIFRNKNNVQTLMENVTSIDKINQNLHLEDGQTLHYDYLILSPGSRHAYFGNNQWEPFAPGLKTLKDALYIREKILSSFEKAETEQDDKIISSLLTFVVIGGGPTGVEMAGAIAEIAHQSLRKNFRKIDPSRTKIYLIEGGKQLLNSYPQKLAETAQKDLEKKRVTILLNSRVTNITPDGVYLGEELISSPNVIWAAGNQASPLLKTLDVPLDPQGRVIVESDLHIKDFSSIFVIGDAAFLKNNKGLPLPAIAPVAVQQGKYVGKLIRKDLVTKNHKPFHYFDKGMMAAIGKYDALVLSGPLQSSGFIAWLAWCFVHIYFLIGYRTKLFVFLQWAFYFFRGQRNVRLIINPPKEKL